MLGCCLYCLTVGFDTLRCPLCTAWYHSGFLLKKKNKITFWFQKSCLLYAYETNVYNFPTWYWKINELWIYLVRMNLVKLFCKNLKISESSSRKFKLLHTKQGGWGDILAVCETRMIPIQEQNWTESQLWNGCKVLFLSLSQIKFNGVCPSMKIQFPDELWKIWLYINEVTHKH